LITGNLRYGGPTIVGDHGSVVERLTEKCIEEVKESEIIFAWVDGTETIGTIAEIGAAFAYRKPIFVAFANGDLAEQFYFAKQLATVAIVASTPNLAWKLSNNGIETASMTMTWMMTIKLRKPEEWQAVSGLFAAKPTR